MKRARLFCLSRVVFFENNFQVCAAIIGNSSGSRNKYSKSSFQPVAFTTVLFAENARQVDSLSKLNIHLLKIKK